MSVTVDVNVLLYAADVDSHRYQRARDVLQGLVEGAEIVYLFWPVLHAYLRMATHPRIFARPLPLEAAMSDVDFLLSAPNARAVSESPGHWETFSGVLREVNPRGDLVADAHIVALMRQYDAATIWTADRDLRKFDGIRVVDPFAAA